MVGINFDKNKMLECLEALDKGQPIKAQTRDEVLALAGACVFLAISQGPWTVPLEVLEKMHMEHREAHSETFTQETLAAVEFYSLLAMQAYDGNLEYPEKFRAVLNGRNVAILKD